MEIANYVPLSRERDAVIEAAVAYAEQPTRRNRRAYFAAKAQLASAQAGLMADHLALLAIIDAKRERLGP